MAILLLPALHFMQKSNVKPANVENIVPKLPASYVDIHKHNQPIELNVKIHRDCLKLL